MVDIQKLLGVAIDQRKPRTLHLNHDAVAFSKRVPNVGQAEIDGGHLAGHKRFGMLEAVAEFASQHFATYEHLVAAQVFPLLPQSGSGGIHGMFVDKLDHKIGIRSGRRCKEAGQQWTGQGDVFGEDV